MMRRYLVFALIAAMVVVPCLAQNGEAGDVNAFQQALEQDGFTVQKGEFAHFDFIGLYNAGVLPSAYGNNPTTKYVAIFVPPTPGDTLSERYVEIARALGLSGNSSAFWNIRPDEAVVIVGKTPPECSYFSYDHYLMSRTFGSETRWIFAAIADTINNLVISTEGTPNGSPGDPYNQTTIIVITADKGMYERIRTAAGSAGYPDGIMNTQALPPSILNLGVENTSDTFAIFIRPALFVDEQAGAEYINNTPGTVFRVTPNNATEPDPYDYPQLRVRGTGQTEFDLTDDLNDLRDAILERHGSANARDLPISQAVPKASDVIQRGIDGLGPDSDACYLWTANQTINAPTPPFFNTSLYYDFTREPPVTLSNDTGDFIIVYGVNHVATGKATYSNFGIYGADALNGIVAITDEDLNGTAEEYLPDNPNAKYLYAYTIARNCSGEPNCYAVPYGPGGYGIQPDQPLVVIWRIYLEEATKTGPSYGEIVYDRAIHFGPQS